MNSQDLQKMAIQQCYSANNIRNIEGNVKKELVKNYIEAIKETNYKANGQQLRPNLFYSKKLDEMIFMQKGVDFRLKVSNIYLYIMEKKSNIAREQLSMMTPEERKNFILNNLHNYYIYPEVSIANMCNFIDKADWNYEDSEDFNKLSILKVNQYFRRLGLAGELIKELKSDTLNNGYTSIIGKMSPLDNFDLTDSTYIKNTFEISRIKKDLLLQNSVDIHALAKIYQHLGFIVPEDYMLDKTIKMPVAKHNIQEKDHYPATFTSYKLQPFEILVR